MHRFEQELGQRWPIAVIPEEVVVLAVSGGADSVALANAMVQIRHGKGCVVAHYNHRLRGLESDQDEAFVRAGCQNWQVPLWCGRANPTSFETGGEGLESIARQARYAFLTQQAHHVGARYVVTAHTADDQVETVLQRILRGTGIAGLSGIPFRRNLSEAVSVVRPLLGERRAAVRAYLADVGVPFREDASNADPRFSRNRIRNELLPLLREHYSAQVDDAILRLRGHAADAQRIVHDEIDQLCRRVVTMASVNSVTLQRGKLAEVPRYIIRELLIHIWKQQRWPRQQMTAKRWHEVAELITNPTPKDAAVMLPGSILVRVTIDGVATLQAVTQPGDGSDG